MDNLGVTYGQAWALWWQGLDLRDHVLWGVQVVWWGRIGKVVGLLSAFSIVAEIVGPSRLRAAGGQLADLISAKRLWKSAWRTADRVLEPVESFLELGIWGEFKNSGLARRLGAPSALRMRDKDGGFEGYFLLASLVAFVVAYWTYEELPYLQGRWAEWRAHTRVMRVFGTIIITVFCGVILCVPIMFAASLLLLLGDFCVIQPAAWASVVLLLIGFHFDLLAS